MSEDYTEPRQALEFRTTAMLVLLVIGKEKNTDTSDKTVLWSDHRNELHDSRFPEVTSIVLMYAAETQIANGIPEKELRYF
jgi:hypothetical protein